MVSSLCKFNIVISKKLILPTLFTIISLFIYHFLFKRKTGVLGWLGRVWLKQINLGCCNISEFEQIFAQHYKSAELLDNWESILLAGKRQYNDFSEFKVFLNLWYHPKMKPGQHFIRRKQQRLHDTKSDKDLLFLVALYLKHSSK